MAGIENETEISLLVVNVGLNESKKGERAIRRDGISRLLKASKPNLILFQEFPWLTGFNRKFDTCIKDKYGYKGHTEAGIAWEKDVLSITDEKDLRKTLEEMNLPTHFTPIPRMQLGIVKIKKNPGIKFICVSWHGRRNFETTNKERREEQIQDLTNLLYYIQKIAEKRNLEFIIGGDFNISIQHAKEIIEDEELHLVEFTESERRTNKRIDYIVSSKHLKLNKINVIDWDTLKDVNDKAYPFSDLLNHDPICSKVAAVGKPSQGKVPERSTSQSMTSTATQTADEIPPAQGNLTPESLTQILNEAIPVITKRVIFVLKENGVLPSGTQQLNNTTVPPNVSSPNSPSIGRSTREEPLQSVNDGNGASGGKITSPNLEEEEEEKKKKRTKKNNAVNKKKNKNEEDIG